MSQPLLPLNSQYGICNRDQVIKSLNDKELNSGLKKIGSDLESKDRMVTITSIAVAALGGLLMILPFILHSRMTFEGAMAMLGTGFGIYLGGLIVPSCMLKNRVKNADESKTQLVIKAIKELMETQKNKYFAFYHNSSDGTPYLYSVETDSQGVAKENPKAQIKKSDIYDREATDSEATMYVSKDKDYEIAPKQAHTIMRAEIAAKHRSNWVGPLEKLPTESRVLGDFEQGC